MRELLPWLVAGQALCILVMLVVVAVQISISRSLRRVEGELAVRGHRSLDHQTIPIRSPEN